MPIISILKVENPSCLWGRVSQDNIEKTEQHKTLLTQINLFYHDVNLDLHKLKPMSIEEGQVYVVYWSMMKSWCRAVVESVVKDSASCRARCLLVDYGERLVITKDQIRVAVDKFLQLPFWMRKFHLAGLKPTTLRVSLFEEKAELVPSTQWDSSATLYLHNLLQASTLTEAVLFETESDSTSIKLYLTVGNIKMCVNDDLVAKKFASYSKGSPENTRLDLLDRIPSILTLTVSTPSNKLTAKNQPSPVISNGAVVGRADDWLTASSSSQSQQHELMTFEGDIKPNIADKPTSNRSRSSSHPAAVDSDSSDGTDSSLAAALTRNLSLFKFWKFLNPGSIFHQPANSVSQHEELSHGEPKETIAASGTCIGQEDNQPVTVDEEVFHMSGKSEDADIDLNHVENLADEDTSSSRSVQSGPTEAEMPRRSKMDQTCSRFLEWLNPEPLESHPEAGDDAPDCPQVVPSDPMKSGILVHSAFAVQPCTSLEDAPITDALRSVLRRKQYSTLSPADRYSWPPVSQGHNTIVISQGADQPLSYLAPLLSHVLLSSIFCSFTSSTGPIVVVLCPKWEKVQTVYDLLENIKGAQILHPFSLLVGVGKDEAKTVKIPKNCLLLVTTPFSLVRLLSFHCFMFLRLCHLVLDEADQLFTHAPDEMATILQHFQKVTSSEGNVSWPQQLVAVAKQWTSQMEALLTNYMPYPCIVITIPEEAALYGHVQQLILMTPESSKISELLGTLDFSLDVCQKTLIITNSAHEVENVFMAVKNKSLFCLKTHEGLTHQFEFVIQEWRKNIGRGTHVILVTTNECLKCFGIKDATCVIHYGFPTSPKLFGSRLLCLSDNFRNFSGRVFTQDQTESCPSVIRSVLLISERNASHVVGVLRYLGRTDALLPPELLSFAQGVLVAREDLKINRPLCSYLKNFGVCRDSSTCSDRHRFVSQLDQSELPASGVIEVVPVSIKTASVFYGRIVTKDSGFDSLASEMTSYYADKKPGAEVLVEGGLYAVEEDDFFHRVKILSVPDRGTCLFFTLFVRFIDVGKEEEVKSHQILQLPEQFHALPAQAVEIIVCSVKPVDAEIDWHPKVTRAISQKIKGLQHRARAVLSLGNTVFVDSMVRVTRVPGMKTVINEYAVRSEILNTGMGVGNPEHLDLLKQLCQGGETNNGKEAGHITGLKDGSMSPELRIKAEECAMAEVFRAAEARMLSDLPQLEPVPDLPQLEPVPDLPQLEPLNLVSSMKQCPVPESSLCPVSLCDQEVLSDIQAANEQRSNHTGKQHSFEHIRNGDGELCPTTSLAAGDDQNNSQQVTTEIDSDGSTKSFHPQVRWYQTSDSVIATVKLMNPESQRCDFSPDRVTYRSVRCGPPVINPLVITSNNQWSFLSRALYTGGSGYMFSMTGLPVSCRVNGRNYRADLELHDSINAGSSHWEMKSNEPVIKLVKRRRGYWEKLLRNKNIFVNYDMDHIEQDEDKAPNGLSFVANTGENDWYVDSETDSD
ncbi:putative ATP-dependent RNA helicase TDRD12 isoform X2 [Solea solea]|uniref:putative ATP-dependent RNA helicase TDRD12 isoform X2 n=1 Tax=Solea solea TaxID=90069 RepID=UPI00272ACDDA|nr:putative ATP-dependent RNA helicase TDRD12 isoform X2 [Solea solea]